MNCIELGKRERAGSRKKNMNGKERAERVGKDERETDIIVRHQIYNDTLIKVMFL